MTSPTAVKVVRDTVAMGSSRPTSKKIATTKTTWTGMDEPLIERLSPAGRAARRLQRRHPSACVSAITQLSATTSDTTNARTAMAFLSTVAGTASSKGVGSEWTAVLGTLTTALNSVGTASTTVSTSATTVTTSTETVAPPPELSRSPASSTNGSEVAATKWPPTFAMSGVATALGLKILGSGTLAETFSDFKRSLETRATCAAAKAETACAESKKDLPERVAAAPTQMSAQKSEETGEPSIIINAMMEIKSAATDEIQHVISKQATSDFWAHLSMLPTAARSAETTSTTDGTLEMTAIS
mmetsp:Transcript_1989/g.2506  ORF Transcript_1989/g.2506 Transcript_1989/m.2506 type:complete len:300 (-) Transcript_1989:1270-2169(-)